MIQIQLVELEKPECEGDSQHGKACRLRAEQILPCRTRSSELLQNTICITVRNGSCWAAPVISSTFAEKTRRPRCHKMRNSCLRRADNISLCIMTRELCHELFKGWENDPALYADMDQFSPYRYDEVAVDRYFDAKQSPSRVHFAIMKGEEPIGDLHLKHIDYEKKECTLGIHMQNDAVKGLGYGTRAEQLALQYAFDVLGMRAVNANTIIQNTRSQHVLEKVGFKYLREENGFKYYRCER